VKEQSARLIDEPARAWLLGEARRLIQFAKGAQTPRGGFGWLDSNGRREDRPLELYMNCRMSHVFSIGQTLRDTDSSRYLESGIDAISSLFADRANGGWFHTVDTAGAVEDTKTAYDHAFVVLAATSAVARGTAGAAQLLRRALQVFNDRFWDEKHGLVQESFSADWSQSEPYRGVNSNMHTVEAFLAASDVTGHDVWRQRALRIADRVVNDWAREIHWRIPEHFDENWQPQPSYNIARPSDPFRPYGSTIGHGMEWARLCLHLDAALRSSSPSWLVDAAVNPYSRAKHDGWARDGADGFVYTVDWNGDPVIHERMHWVAAEATAAATLHRATGDPSYADNFHKWWEYIRSYLVDHANGSWHHELSRTNGPSSTVCNGKPDVYHAVQACLIPLLPLQPSIALSATAL